MTQTRINVITYKNRMEPSRKNLFWVGRRQLRNLWGLRPSKARGRSSWILWQPLVFHWGRFVGCLLVLAPSKVWGIGVGIRSGLGRSSNLPCPGSYFYTICLAWLACLEYLAGLYRGILRLPVGPLLGGHCPGSLQVQCEAGDTSGTTYCFVL